MIETKEKVIDGASYSVTQLPARRALRLKAKLIKHFGPVLAQVFANSKSSDENDLVKCVELLAGHIDENTFEDLITSIIVGVRKNGMELTAPTIDLEFAGDLATLYKVVWFVLEVNFSSFFTMIGIGNPLTNDPIPTKQTPDTKKTFIRK